MVLGPALNDKDSLITWEIPQELRVYFPGARDGHTSFFEKVKVFIIQWNHVKILVL